MYPMCCIDIRNFLNQFYFFSDDHFQHPNVIDETLKKVRHLWKLVGVLLTTSTVSGRTSYRKGLQVVGRAIEFPIPGSNRTDSH
jgi:hypothetical protein